ncbi:MAG: DsbA family protein, partial [Acidimicrobiaceae bacterium]
MATRTVDMWMDFGCPWSRISLHELERVISDTSAAVDVSFHSLRLDADAPADYGKTTIENLCEHLSIDVAEAERMLQVVVDAGARVGLGFNFHTARGGSSFDAHRLVRRAADFGVHLAVARDVFTAHFENGELISDHAALQQIGVRAGMPVDVVSSLFAGDELTAEVLE